MRKVKAALSAIARPARAAYQRAGRVYAAVAAWLATTWLGRLYRAFIAGLESTWLGSRLLHLVRAAKVLVKDANVPRVLRWSLFVCLLPWPGPADNVLALVPLALIFLLHRPALARAWADTAR